MRVKHVPFQPRLLWCQPKRKCYLHPGTPISQHPRSSVFARNQRHASVNTPLGGTRDDTITTGVCDFGNHHIVVVVVVDRASARVPSSSLIHSVICARAVRETAHRRRQSRYQTKTPTRRADGRVGFARAMVCVEIRPRTHLRATLAESLTTASFALVFIPLDVVSRAIAPEALVDMRRVARVRRVRRPRRAFDGSRARATGTTPRTTRTRTRTMCRHVGFPRDTSPIDASRRALATRVSRANAGHRRHQTTLYPSGF